MAKEWPRSVLFNSFEFALFFPLVTAGYFLLPHRHRWWWLLAASCSFYMAVVPVYILILAFVVIGAAYALVGRDRLVKALA